MGIAPISEGFDKRIKAINTDTTKQEYCELREQIINSFRYTNCSKKVTYDRLNLCDEMWDEFHHLPDEIRFAK
jgi:hypothetical protein